MTFPKSSKQVQLRQMLQGFEKTQHSTWCRIVYKWFVSQPTGTKREYSEKLRWSLENHCTTALPTLSRAGVCVYLCVRVS